MNWQDFLNNNVPRPKRAAETAAAQPPAVVPTAPIPSSLPANRPAPNLSAAYRNRMVQQGNMIGARNAWADAGLGQSTANFSPHNIYSRLSMAAKSQGVGSPMNLSWPNLFRAALGDNSVLAPQVQKQQASRPDWRETLGYKKAAEEPKQEIDRPDFGFKPGPQVPLEDAYKTWSTSARGATDNTAFLNATGSVVDKALKMHAGGVDAPYLRSRARMLALGAAENWDPNRSKLETHMLNSMLPLKRLATNTTSQIKAPEDIRYEAKKLRDKEDELKEQYGRDPTDAELMDSMHMPAKRLRRLRELSVPVTYSGQFLESQEQPAVEQDQEDMWMDLVYHDLGPVDKTIFESRLGYNGKPQLKTEELSKKLGMSNGMVSRRAEAIAKRVAARPKGW